MSKNNHIIQSWTEDLNNYLEQIKNNEPLTVEQEQALGRRLMSGDYKARNELIEANLHFVLSCAIEMRTPYVPIEELVAAGNYGLTLAATLRPFLPHSLLFLRCTPHPQGYQRGYQDLDESGCHARPSSGATSLSVTR